MNNIDSYLQELNEEVLTLYYSIYDPTMKTPASLTGTEYNLALNRLQGFYN